MIGRRTRASMWKLLLPLPLAALIVIAAGMLGRSWYTASVSPRPGRAARVAAPTGAAALAQTTPSRIPAAYHQPTPQADASALAPVPAATARRQRPPLAPKTLNAPSNLRYSFGPAPEPVAPSNEAALRPSEPPPAVVSAPRPAPVTTTPLVPAPEPQAPARISPMRPPEPQPATRPAAQVRAVRFDASYYYGRGLSARELAEELAQGWADQGINLVYFYAYNRVYGARYRTRYTGNIMEDYGRQDLLRHVLRECHKRSIKVIAWLQGVQHKQIWEAHPAWRQKTAEGSDYKPDTDSYFLCVRNPEVMQWWLGLVDELLQSYPDLDGVDLAEFQLDLWGDHACYCEHCRDQFAQAHPRKNSPGDEWREFRAEGLSRIILATSRLAHSYGKDVHVTTVLTARPDGKLMTSAQLRDAIGFDLEAILSNSDRPDVLQAELIWQQWAATYRDRSTFTPEWTTGAVRQAKGMIRGRARLIAHVEVTDFGGGGLDGPRLARTIAAASEAGPLGVDIYDAHLLAQTEGAARYLQLAWAAAEQPRVSLAALGNGG